MKQIALVTDSTADFPEEFRKECDAQVIPLKVLFGEEEFYDGELSSEEFYQRLGRAAELPKTSQPSPEDFISLYTKLLDEYHEIISIHISSGLSGTINAARIAKEKLKGRIHLIDSKTISMGIGLMLLEASKLIREGLDSVHILERLSDARNNIETIFTLDTLEYLQKGGRIGRVEGIMGTFLKIKPIIRVGDDGVYQTYAKVRSQEKALNTIVQAFQELSRGRKQVRFAVAHGAAYEAGSYLKDELEKALQIPTTMLTQVGPVIGVHTGPGTIGAAIQYE